MTQLYPLIALLVAALIVNVIPMNGTIKQVINILVGVAALLLVLKLILPLA